MRYLHDIAAHEMFVASGEYHYERDGDSMNIIESWTIHELPGGALFYRTDEDGRDEDGLSILSEALLSPNGKIERFNVQSFNPLDDETKQFKADYTFHDTYVQIGRKIQGQEREYQEFALLENSVIYIRQTLFMGATIRDILQQEGTAHVFSPQLISMEDSHMLKIIAKEQAVETLQVSRKQIEARKIQIADETCYWLDEHNIPLKRSYSVDNVQYIARLKNYAHR